MDDFIGCLAECFGELCCMVCCETAADDGNCKTAALITGVGIAALAAPVCLILGIVFLVKRSHYTAGAVLTVTGSILTFLLAVWGICRAVVHARRCKHVQEIVRNAPPEKNLYRSGLVFDKKDKKSKTVTLAESDDESTTENKNDL